MRRAVVHVNLDPSGERSVAELERAVAALRAAGHEVIASDLERLPRGHREIELLRGGDDAAELRRAAQEACVTALARGGASGAAPLVTAVGFMSSGTEEDVVGIVRAFELGEQLREVDLGDEDVAVLVFAPGAAIPAALVTALEAALNREVSFAATAPR